MFWKKKNKKKECIKKEEQELVIAIFHLSNELKITEKINYEELLAVLTEGTDFLQVGTYILRVDTIDLIEIEEKE